MKWRHILLLAKNDNRHDDIGCSSIHFKNILLLLSPSIAVVYCGDDISFFFAYIVASIIVAAFESETMASTTTCGL
jgi:hypothetical protein